MEQIKLLQQNIFFNFRSEYSRGGGSDVFAPEHEDPFLLHLQPQGTAMSNEFVLFMFVQCTFGCGDFFFSSKYFVKLLILGHSKAFGFDITTFVVK